ncbi:MAG TPA: tail fiber domain-containing protein, partial [Crocinitomix sp.]|nr:tail fiber domain-containing protein [Crocinitomix sp.]
VDMFSVTATNAINYAINGYCNTTPLGAGVYGFSSNVTNQKAAVWGDINSTNAQASAVLGQYLQATGAGNGVYGFTNSTSAVGVRGYKPAGGLGWGGLFLNDLGYTGFFGLASDEKLKTNIRPISNSLSVINSIKVYSYHYDINKYPNLGDSTLHFGVMAQELEVILPNLVKTKNIDLHNTQANEKDKKVDYKEPEQVKTVNYLELVPILIQGIQEQQQIINAQQQQIDSLNTRLNKLEEKE